MKESLMTIGIFVVFVPSLIFVFNFFLYKNDRIEKRIERSINQECIKGNKVSIAIKKDTYFRCSAKDEDLIMEALKGNEFAIDALKIDMKEKK